jgi:hypothetical protein
VHPFSRLIIAFLCVVGCCCALPNTANAVGWGPDDFIIGGGTNTGGQVGIFDPNLVFKGYLERPSSFGVDDFNRLGQLVGREGTHSVRVFDASGDIVGGFASLDFMPVGKLNVAPNGNYLVPLNSSTTPGGVGEYQPDGTLVRRLGTGIINSLAVIPGDKMWAWFPDDGRDVVRVYDLASGAQSATITLSGIAPNHMRFSPTTNTMLIASIQAQAVFEADYANGLILQTFHAPADADLTDVTRGPNGDVLATDTRERVLRWRQDGSFIGSLSTTELLGRPSQLIWEGNTPEPNSTITMSFLSLWWGGRRKRRIS